jgi:hypothetical protein
MSAWICELVAPGGERVDGVQYLSKHGDNFVLRAIYERGSADSLPEVTARAEPRVIPPAEEALREAMRIHRMDWLCNRHGFANRSRWISTNIGYKQ